MTNPTHTELEKVQARAIAYLDTLFTIKAALRDIANADTLEQAKDIASDLLKTI